MGFAHVLSMLNDKHGPIGKALQGIQPKYREVSFMVGQLGERAILHLRHHSVPRSRLSLLQYILLCLCFPRLHS